MDQLDLFAQPDPAPAKVCTCLRTRGGSGEGFTNVGGQSGDDWWVHAGCGLPTAQYRAAMSW